MYHIVFVNEPVLLEWRINKTEDLPDYYDYYKGIGFYLEGGDGYYYFTRKESKVDLERKLEAIQKCISWSSVFSIQHTSFGIY